MSIVRRPSASQASARGNAGTVAIEFAIVAPLLLLMVAVIAETAAFTLVQFQLQFATDFAAKQIRLGRVGPQTSTSPSNQMGIGDFKDTVCKKIDVANCSSVIWVDVRKGTTFSAINAAMPPSPQDVGPSTPGSSYSEAYDPGAPGDMGSLIVTYDWAFLFPHITSFFGNVKGNSNIRRLYGVAIYRNEM